MRSFGIIQCAILCILGTLVTITLGHTESPSLSSSNTAGQDYGYQNISGFPLANAVVNQPCTCYQNSSSNISDSCACSHDSCLLLGENYDVDYRNDTLCIISPMTNNNPYSSRNSPSTEIICPFDDMVISRIIFARWAKYYYVLGPRRCQPTSGTIVDRCSVPSSTMISTLTPLCVGNNRCTVPATYDYWNHFHRMRASCNTTTPLLTQVFSSFSFQCVKAPRTNCYLYDTFCHAFKPPRPVTGGMIKWEQPFSVNLGGSLNKTFNQACNGLISDDYHCLSYYDGSVSYTNSFCANRLTNVTFALTATTTRSVGGKIYLYVDDTLMGAFDMSQRYVSEYSVEKFVIGMPSSFVISAGRHYVTFTAFSLSGGDIYIRDFTMSSNVTDNKCLSTCQIDSQSQLPSALQETQSNTERASDFPSFPETVSQSETYSMSKTRTATKSAIHTKTHSHSNTHVATRTRIMSNTISHTKTHSPHATHSRSAPKTHSRSRPHSASPTIKKTESVTMTAVMTNSYTDSASKSATASHTATSTESISLSGTNSRTQSLSDTNSRTRSLTQTESISNTDSDSRSKSISTTDSRSNSRSISTTDSRSNSRSISATDSRSNSRSRSASGSRSDSKSISDSRTLSNTRSLSLSISRSDSNTDSNSNSRSASITMSRSDSKSQSRSDSNSKSQTTSESISQTYSASQSRSASLSRSASDTMSRSESSSLSQSESTTAVFHSRVLGGVVGQVIFSVGVLLFVCCTGCFLIIVLLPRYRRRRND
jgi:hypothetical protein